MYCPKCGRKFKHERICPTCHRVLVEERPDADDASGAAAQPFDEGSDDYGFERDDSQSGSERIFQTKDMGLLPLATMALDSAGIHYNVQRGAEAALIGAAAGIELHVRSADAEEARQLLADLEHAGERGVAVFDPHPSSADQGSGSGSPKVPTQAAGTASITLIDVESGWQVSAISEEQLEWLGQRLERDEGKFYVDFATLDMLEAEGAEPGLVDALRTALGEREGVDLRPTSELLFDADTGSQVGVVSQDQLRRLLEHGAVAEIELTDALIAGLEADGADAGLIDVLRRAADDGATHVTAVKPGQRRQQATLALMDTQSDRAVGALTEHQAAWLAERLELETAVFDKPDYCIDRDVIDYLQEEGAQADLLETLREALGDRKEMFVRW